MTTAAQRMLALSPLAGAHSARAHFLAITQGTGTDRIIFASQFSVGIEEPQIFAVQRPKRESRGDFRPAVSRLSGDEKRKDVSVFTREAALSVLTEIDDLVIQQGSTESVVVQDLGRESFTVRQSDVLEMN